MMTSEQKTKIYYLILSIPLLLFDLPAIIITLLALLTYIYRGETLWLLQVRGDRFIALIIVSIFSLLPIAVKKILEE